MARYIFLILVSFSVSACVSSQRRSEFAQDSAEVSVMAYNVENLFDTLHDEGTEDHTYLPKKVKLTPEHQKVCDALRSQRYRNECLHLDWSEDTLHEKMRRLTEAVLQVNNGRGPDVLILEEVENKRVLEQWNREHLKAAGYQTIVLIEGFDKRGIDIGLMSRLPLNGDPQLHRIAFTPKSEEDRTWMARTRGILEVPLRLPDGNKLVVYGVHFPNPNNPLYWRQQATVFLNQLVDKLPAETVAVAGGDFNISSSEDAKERMYEKFESHWLVSHRIGCGDCRGTNYWHTGLSWSFLDALMFRKNMDPKEGKSAWMVVPESVGIPKYSVYQSNRFKSPARFEVNAPMGVSDHWPIYARLRLRTGAPASERK